MQRRAGLFLLLGASAAGVAAQTMAPAPQPAPGRAAISVIGLLLQAVSSPIAVDIAQWNSLRQSDNLPFSSYANFLAGHRGWPGEAAMRRSAERRLSMETASPGDVARFFGQFPPLTPGGHAQHAFALDAIGRSGEAREAARRAWTGGVLAQTDEARLLGRFGGSFGPEEHDRRLEALLGNGDTQTAARSLSWAPAGKRTLFETRLALQTRAADAASRLAMLDPSALRDPGLIVDRANWLRNTGQSAAARALLAGRPRFERAPANAEAWLETALTLARGAAADRNWQTAYEIAAKVDDLYPAGTDVSDRPFAERDAYTSLVWLGGTTAFYRGNRPADAARLFDLYARAARSPQTRSKGLYWAGRAADAAGRGDMARSYYESAAALFDQFYGQLSAERLGRPPVIPPMTTRIEVSANQRDAFFGQEIVRATQILGQRGDHQTQTIFVRQIAQAATSDVDHVLAVELASRIARPDLAVMIGRSAGINGYADYVRAGFPVVPVPEEARPNWTMVHAISRQESQFDRMALSRAGARGYMQLMPGTARETSVKIGAAYDAGGLTSDTQYNIRLGNDYFSRMMSYYSGSYPLAVAAYNAGPGNVNKWLRANGDPRTGSVDILNWIEAIPLTETRGYVQRVLENAVVYDMIDPSRSRVRSNTPLSSYLGKRMPG